jgi:hypothetical protein
MSCLILKFAELWLAHVGLQLSAQSKSFCNWLYIATTTKEREHSSLSRKGQVAEHSIFIRQQQAGFCGLLGEIDSSVQLVSRKGGSGRSMCKLHYTIILSYFRCLLDEAAASYSMSLFLRKDGALYR